MCNLMLKVVTNSVFSIKIMSILRLKNQMKNSARIYRIIDFESFRMKSMKLAKGSFLDMTTYENLCI